MNIIKAWRSSIGISQVEAARLLGCTARSVKKWESRDDYQPHRRTLLAMAAISNGIEPWGNNEGQRVNHKRG